VFQNEGASSPRLNDIFRHVRKFSKSDHELCHACPSVRPSVRLSAWNNSALTGRFFMKFYISVKVKQSGYRPGVAQRVPGS
jgi:hypothetical protein